MVSVNVPQEAIDLMENFDPSSLEGVDYGYAGDTTDYTIGAETEPGSYTRKAFAQALLT